MIQRVQTIFLFIAAVAMVSMIFFPIWQKVDINTSEIATIDAISLTYEKFSETNFEERELILEKTTVYIAILAIISALVSTYSVFQYSNRLRQIQLGALNSLVMAGVVITAAIFAFKAEPLLAVGSQGSYLIGFYLPIGALFCNFMANRFIRRDEKLVKSMDRIR